MKPFNLFVPEIGTVLMLAKPWTFTLHQEHRNSDVWDALDCDNHPARAEHEAWKKRTEASIADIEKRMEWSTHYSAFGRRPRFANDTDERQYYELRRLLYQRGPAVPVTLPKGTTLKVDRIYIRKGNEDYSSLTFFVVDTPLPALNPTERKKKVGSKGRRRFWAKLADVNTMVVQPVAQDDA